MKKILYSLIIILLIGCKTKQTDLSEEIEWIHFTWEKDSLGGKYYDKLGIKVPITINDSITNFAQFDLGANTNMLYEGTLKNYFNIPKVFDKDTTDTEESYYWIRKPNIKIGKELAQVKNWVVRTNYDAQGLIGTIGAEELKNRSLIIDFPNNKMAILDSVQKTYKKQFKLFDFNIINNKVILTVLINGKKHNVNFDTGSSITPLFVSDQKLYNEITDISLASDTLREFNSWGKTYDNIYGAAIKKNLIIGEKDFGHQMVYYLDSEYHRNLFQQDSIVALLGSIVFFQEEILIDFKNQKMGLKSIK